MDIVVEIKNRLSIEDFMAEYLTLRSAGKNFKGLSPFKNEKTPSFYVSVDKQIAWCFATSQGGDVFTMYQLLNGVEFPEALRDLAYKVGLGSDWEATKKDFSPEKAQLQANLKSSLKAMHLFAMQEYKVNLKSTTGKSVMQYLADRKISPNTISKFGLGLALQSKNGLVGKLLNQGFKPEEMPEAGLCMGEDLQGKNLKDRFSHRLMVPIFNEQNECVAFGGRVLDASQNPKYLNSKETPIYKKNALLYGYNFAKAAMLSKSAVILVEGYFDVMALHQAGFENVVAISGTALTANQVRLLKRQASTVYLALDSDEAGQTATLRSVKLLLEEDLQLRFVNLVNDKDVADYLLTEDADFQGILDDSLDLLGFFKKTFPALDAENINLVLKEFFEIITNCKSQLQMREFLKLFAASYEIEYDLLLNNFRKFQSKKKGKKTQSVASQTVKTKNVDLELRFWSLAFMFPRAFATISEPVFKASQVFEEFANFEKVKLVFKGSAMSELDLPQDLKVKILELEALQARPEAALIQEMQDLLTALKSQYKKQGITRIKNDNNRHYKY